ncbi:MAG: acetate kinase [Bacteroidota bacterium]
MLVLVLNCGSSSLKFDLINVAERQTIVGGVVERIGAVSSIASWALDDDAAPGGVRKQRKSLDAPDHTTAIQFVLNEVLTLPEAQAAGEIEAVGHRVVHGGEDFADSVLIDDEVIEAIRDAFDLAPLHNPANLKGIRAAQAAFPDVPHVAVFDTAFHQTLPPEAYLYAIPNRLYRRHKIRRYGFHGTSHYYVSRRLYEAAGLDKQKSRVITCHLGNGASLCAIRNGKSVDTSMGMTPLAGLVMGTRSGTIDPSIIFDLVAKEDKTLAEVHTMLNKYSGLLGLSGYAADMRDLIREAADGDVRCQQAINVFCQRVKGYIGMYMAVLNGADAVVFTAGIGENAPSIRAQICKNLDHLGICIDASRNDGLRGEERRISTDDSAVQVWVIPTDEEFVIATDARKIAETLKQTPFV